MNARLPLFTTLTLWLGMAWLSAGVLAFAQSNYRFDAATVSGLPARNIGSVVMSGRIAAVDAVDQDGRITVFVGAASGGVWKSVNGGTTYKPVFDREAVQSIGAVAIDPSNPKTVWVGTGEAWTRNSVSIGDGVYRSTDGGRKWDEITAGLPSEFGFAMVAHPRDPLTVWNIPLTQPDAGRFMPDGHASVWRTHDGGDHWIRGDGGLPKEDAYLGVLREAMARDDLDPVGIYFGTSTGQLYGSADVGASWT